MVPFQRTVQSEPPGPVGGQVGRRVVSGPGRRPSSSLHQGTWVDLHCDSVQQGSLVHEMTEGDPGSDRDDCRPGPLVTLHRVRGKVPGCPVPRGREFCEAVRRVVPSGGHGPRVVVRGRVERKLPLRFFPLPPSGPSRVVGTKNGPGVAPNETLEPGQRIEETQGQKSRDPTLREVRCPTLTLKGRFTTMDRVLVSPSGHYESFTGHSLVSVSDPVQCWYGG